MQLGDMVEAALAAVGVTDDRVQRLLGRPCGCKERKERLNAIGAWAVRVLKGKTKNALKYLESLLCESES